MTLKGCKDCLSWWSAQTREFRQANRMSDRPTPHPGPRCATHWREFRKGQKARTHAKYVSRTYSLEEHEYGKLYEGQGGTCAICQRATGATRKLSVDHDHKCCSGGISCGHCVRGLLCRPCNDMLGHARDNWEMFARAIRYLLKPPAHSILDKKRPDSHAPNTRSVG